MFGVKIRRIRSVWCFISIINQRILTSAGSQPPSQRGRMALKALPADKKQESGESWMPRVWFEKLFWGPSGPSPIISPTSHPFSLYKQVKNKPVSQWDAPHRWELRLLTKFPGCIPGTCPPLRFYNTLHLHKVLLGNKKKKKAGPVNEWPLKRILPLVFCCSHGLVWFIIPQQEVNKDTFEHRCIQIHRKKNSKPEVSFGTYKSTLLLKDRSQGQLFSPL